MTSIQQLFQLTVSIAFNFLGNWVDLASRQADGKTERVWGCSNRVRVGSGLNKREFIFSWVSRPNLAWWPSGVRDPSS